ncbi:hypothetical protein [Nitrobacter sp. JJSN]|uniref:hypothetical protein n=1 Tax=Nitrobacter sp. JJSN TaxID=3453033 RepID=UPI003F760064
MLPGFRFLSVAILLAVSMLIFGLGAAALLRATHEEFASQPLKQMPEVTFGVREETERPTLAVLRIDTPAADSAEPRPDQAEARHPLTASPDVHSESNAAALPATGASSAATDTPSVSTASSSSAPPQVADTAPSPDAATAKSSEPPPGAEASVDAGDAVKPDIAETDAAKSNAIKSNVGASDVAETMTSPLGEHVRPPLPGRRPTQIAQAADPTPRGVKQPSTKPSRLAKQHRHRKVIRRSLPARSAAPNPAPPSASPFALD